VQVHIGKATLTNRLCNSDPDEAGNHFVSVRQQIREGAQPGATVCFPRGARKTEFWSTYPSDELAFRNCVLPESYSEEGIVFVSERTFFHEPRELKDSYRGLSREKVARFCFFWQSDRDEFEERHPPETIEAIQDFLADRSRRQEEGKEWLAEERERCEPPTPPVGYRWRLETGFVEKYILMVGDLAPT
jgi:hypothetical protein